MGVAQGIPYTLQGWTYHPDREHHIDHWREEGRREREEEREGERREGERREGERRERGGGERGREERRGRRRGERGEGHIYNNYNNTVIIIQTLVYTLY